MTFARKLIHLIESLSYSAICWAKYILMICVVGYIALVGLKLQISPPKQITFVLPLRTTITDATTGKPLAGVLVQRMVTEFHDYNFDNAYIDSSRSGADGVVMIEKKTRVLFSKQLRYVDNHQVFITKPGYKAVVFSQYSVPFFKIRQETRNPFVKSILSSLPDEKKIHDIIAANEMLLDGKVRLEPLRQNVRYNSSEKQSEL